MVTAVTCWHYLCVYWTFGGSDLAHIR